MMTNTKVRAILLFFLILTFGVLIFGGYLINRAKPPIPVKIVTPSGFYQLYFAVKYGLWFARSPEITSGPVIRALSWARLVPDVIFATGAIVLFVFLLQAIWLTFIKKAEATAFSDRPQREQEAR
ncbi:MAG: hypothetical protein R6W88_10445 [Desulfobacterales bacterium]